MTSPTKLTQSPFPYRLDPYHRQCAGCFGVGWTGSFAAFSKPELRNTCPDCGGYGVVCADPQGYHFSILFADEPSPSDLDDEAAGRDAA